MSEPGPYIIVPFLRPSRGGAGELLVRVAAGSAEVGVRVARPNGSVAATGTLTVAAGAPVSSRALFDDLFAVAECGAVHLWSSDDAPMVCELRLRGEEGASFGSADAMAGAEFRLETTDPAEGFAVLANGGDSELFVFVNDQQGPFIPPGGAARIQIPTPGGRLHVLIESGDGVLAYLGAGVVPAS